MASKKSKKLKKSKIKSNSVDKDNKVLPTVGIPENILVDQMIRDQKRHLETSDGSKVMVGAWYKSRAGHPVLIDSLCEDGSVKIISHSTGNILEIPPYQVIHFTLSSDPGTPCGVVIVENDVELDVKQNSVNTDLYVKYPHIVAGSIYKMQNMTSSSTIPAWERKRSGKKINIKGQVRCKIICQKPGCSNERDIKVQDAFQVKVCDECRKRKRKKNLNEFLNKDNKVEK